MVKITVYLDDEIAAALKGVSMRSDGPQEELIREALRAYAAGETAPPLPSGMGMFDSDRSHTSARRKKILKKAALTE